MNEMYKFTFHNVSINSAVNTDSEQETRIFTFHNVSINSTVATP